MPTTYAASTTTGASAAPIPALPPALANWVIPQAATATSGPATLDDLAKALGVTTTGPDLEYDVLQALAHRFGVATESITRPGPTAPTPLSPGRVGGQRPRTQGKTPGTPPGTVVAAQQITSPAQIVSELQALTGIRLTGDVNADPRAFLHDPKILQQILTKLPTTELGGDPTGKTAAELYSSIVKQLGNAKFATQMAQYLEAGNFLSASANNDSPSKADIATAYISLLSSAKSAGTSITQAYTANQNASEVPGTGQQPTTPVSELVANIQGMGEKLGVYLSPEDITTISNDVEPNVTSAGGVSEVQDEIKNEVIQYFNPNDPRNPPGAASQMYQDILSAANSYGIPVSSANITKWVTTGIETTAGDSYSIAQAATDTAAAATKTFQTNAAGLYPTLASQIMAGQTVSTLISPYNAITAQYTGVDQNTLDDPGSAPGGPTGKYYAFLQGAKDPQDNSPSMMTMDQWKQQLMQNPTYGFQNTQGGKDMAEQLTAAILNTFGRVNTTQSSSPVTALYSGSPGSANTGGG